MVVLKDVCSCDRQEISSFQFHAMVIKHSFKLQDSFIRTKFIKNTSITHHIKHASYQARINHTSSMPQELIRQLVMKDQIWIKIITVSDVKTVSKVLIMSRYTKF